MLLPVHDDRFRPDADDPREFLEGFGRQTGQRMGVAFATSFEVYPMGWGDEE